MDFFFHPRNVAVIGATPNPFKSGNTIVRNLIGTHKGGVYPVNPKYDRIEDLVCYPTVQAIPEAVDLAIVFVPAAQVVASVEDCVAKGVPGVMIQSGGFAETGARGQTIERRLAEIARETGIRLWGPNCMGLVDAVSGAIFSFMYADELRNALLVDKLSLIVQSGLISAGFLGDMMRHHTSGVSKACSIGNKLDVDECDVLPVLLDDPNTNVVGLYLESIADGRRFIELCRSTDKPIVVLKGGKSARGAQAALSHTASLAGNHRVIEGVLKQAGVVEANDFMQMIDLCRSLSYYPERRIGRGRVGILSYSGAAGILSADFLEAMGLDVADLSPETRTALEALFPDWMPVKNPVDLWPAMEKNMTSGIDVIGEGLDALIADPNVDAVIVTTFAAPGARWFDPDRAGAASHASGKPVFVWVVGMPESILEFKEKCRQNRIPVFQELYRLAECLAAVLGPRATPALVPRPFGKPALALTPELKDVLAGTTGPLDEFDSKRVIAAYGIPTVDEAVMTAAGDGAAAGRFGYPVVMKGLVPEGVHKTEMGLVRLGIRNRSAAARTYRELMRAMAGRGKVLVQKQMEGKIELILGLLRDPQFGPCVMFGLGGILAEAFRDTAFAMAPLSKADALGLISRIRGQALLDGFRGMPAVDRDALADILVALGEIGLAHPRIREIDVNPLLVGPDGMAAVDATIVLGD